MDTPVTCRSCAGSGLFPVLSLGRLPLSNALLTSRQLAEPEETYPLDLVFCPHCSLVQITTTVSPEKLFRHYFYLSSFSDTTLRHAKKLAEELVKAQRLHGDTLVIEVASNDGYLLQYYKQAGIPVLGIEPATNIARTAQNGRGIPTICEFFDERLAARLVEQGQRADVIHANNVLAHVADLNGFVSGLRLILKREGALIVEVPYVKDMIDRCEFDTIYHEHLSYFSLTALDHLFSQHGLIIHDVERLNIHGGTLRIYARHEGGIEIDHSGTVAQMLQEESARGMGDSAFYLGFGTKVAALRGALLTLLHDLKSRGSRIAAYGASA
jgi:uncharacterized protein GlcG (DUF336 family)